MGFLDKLFGKKKNDATGAVAAVNNVVDQVQQAVPGTTGDVVVDKVQDTVAQVADKVETVATQMPAVPEQAAPVVENPAAPTQEEQQPPQPQNPSV